MRYLLDCGNGRLFRVLTPAERRQLREFFYRYNEWGYLGGGYTPGREDIVYKVNGEMLWAAIIHKINLLALAVKYKLSPTNTYIIRRMTAKEKAKGHYSPLIVQALKCLIRYLCMRGAEAVLALVASSLEENSYKKAGFEKLGETRRKKATWYIYRCIK